MDVLDLREREQLFNALLASNAGLLVHSKWRAEKMSAALFPEADHWTAGQERRRASCRRRCL